jgi:hypothetical protein
VEKIICSNIVHKGNIINVHNIQEAIMIEDVARIVPRIYATLEDCQVYHESIVVQVEGKILKQYISILIDHRSSNSYVTPTFFETCALEKCDHSGSWLVQLAIETRRKIIEVVERCPLEFNGLCMWVYMNIFPLGSYDISLEWIIASTLS